MATSTPIKNLDQFFGSVLATMGLPNTAPNRNWLKGWAQVEGTAAKNNPLATTLQTTGSQPLPGNSANVQQYLTPEQGVLATASTLHGYPSIVAALGSGNIMMQAFSAPAALVHDFSVWSGNAYKPAAGLAYFNRIMSFAQGNPSQGGANIGAGVSSAVVGAVDAAGHAIASLNPAQIAADAATSALTGAFSGVVQPIVNSAGYALTYAALVGFSIVLAIFGLMSMLGVKPRTVMAKGAQAAAVAA